MKMIPMLKVSQNNNQTLNSKKLKSDTVDKSSFKTEYQNRQDEVNKKSQKISEDDKPKQDEAVKDIKNETTVDESENKEKKEITPETLKHHKKSRDILNNKPIKTDTKSVNEVESTELKESVNKDIKLIKNLKRDSKKVDTKKTSEEGSKRLDKDTLNQSIAASSLVTEQKDIKADKKVNTSNELKVDAEKNLKEGNKTETSKSDNETLNIKTNQEVDPNTFKRPLEGKNEVNKKDKSKNEDNKIKVTDLRKDVKTQVYQEPRVQAENKVLNQSNEVKLETTAEVESSTENTIVLGTTEISAEGDGGKAQAPVLKEASSLLKQQLKDFGNNEIVKQSRFILKDNNVGEIKLILKPEALGQVKINLNLNENSLAGQIVVENNSVKEVFQENLNQLSKALEEKGFDSAKLDVSLSDKGESNSQDKKENRQYFSKRLRKFDDNGQVVRYGAPTVGINLTA